MKKWFCRLGLCVAALLPVVALAADLVETGPVPDPDAASCGCRVPIDAEGLIRSAAGTVFVSGKTGLLPARADARFRLPGRVMTGPNSASVVEIGSRCRLSVTANQSLEMRRQNGQWCVLKVDAGAAGLPAGLSAGLPAAASASSIAAAGTQLVPFAVVSGIAAGSVAISIARDDERVSK